MFQGIFPAELEQNVLINGQFSALELVRYQKVSVISRALIDDRLWRLQGLEIPKPENTPPALHFGRFMQNATVIKRGVDDTDCGGRFEVGRSTILQSVLPHRAYVCPMRDLETDRAVTVFYEKEVSLEGWVFRDAFEGREVTFPIEVTGPRTIEDGFVEGRHHYLLLRQGDTLSCYTTDSTLASWRKRSRGVDAVIEGFASAA